jgi:hypothetical protein
MSVKRCGRLEKRSQAVAFLLLCSARLSSRDNFLLFQGNVYPVFLSVIYNYAEMAL